MGDEFGLFEVGLRGRGEERILVDTLDGVVFKCTCTCIEVGLVTNGSTYDFVTPRFISEMHHYFNDLDMSE